MTVRLIGLCSPAMGSGKTTCADMLVRSHQFVRVAFATPLKSMATALLTSTGMSEEDARDHIYGSRKEAHVDVLGMTPRRLMQLLGTEWGRLQIRDSIWVDIAITRANTLMSVGHSVVIDDMRFPNEYDAIIAAGGDCIRVVRPDATVTSAHASEGQLDGVHMPEIWNVGSLFDLHQATLQRVFA
jgi:hypothetical protein